MEGQGFTRRELFALGALIFLAPALRLFPGQSAAAAGKAAWLTPLCALPLLIAYARFLAALLSLRREGEALPGLILRAAGRPMLALCALWLIFYAAFVLRSGADRFVGTVFPRASWRVFAELMGVLALAGALAGVRALARVGRMLLPLVLGVLLALLIFALFDLRVENLWPLRYSDLPGLARGALLPLDLAAGAAALLCFAGCAEAKAKDARRALTLWMLGLCALLTLLALALTGRFGHELTAELSRPFFVLLRTLRIFRTLERVEALVVMLWIFPDFLAASLFLRAGSDCLFRLLGAGEKGLSAKLALQNEKPLIWGCAAAVIGLSLLIAPDAVRLERWSRTLIPAANLVFCFALLPGVYLLAKAKEKR